MAEIHCPWCDRDFEIPELEETKMRHWSDCAIYNKPVYPKGKCDCGGTILKMESIDKLYRIKEIAISVGRMTDTAPCDNFDEEMDNIISLVNSVLLDEVGAKAVLYQPRKP